MGQLLAILADLWVPITVALIVIIIVGEFLADVLGLGHRKPWE